jgi:hypothetical protein
MPKELDDLEPFVGHRRMTPSFAPNASNAVRAINSPITPVAGQYVTCGNARYRQDASASDLTPP